MTFTLFAIYVFAFVVAILLSALLLKALVKVSKLKVLNYGTCLKIILTTTVGLFVVEFIAKLLSLLLGFNDDAFSLISGVLTLIAEVTLLSILLHTYSVGSWKKIIAVAFLNAGIGLFVSIAITTGARTIIEPFTYDGEGMAPTYAQGTYMFVYKINREFNRGDVITFYRDDGSYWIERIVGLPGETIIIKDGTINAGSVAIPSYGTASTTLEAEFKLDAESYLVVGDNNFSVPTVVPRDDIVGKVVYKI